MKHDNRKMNHTKSRVFKKTAAVLTAFVMGIGCMGAGMTVSAEENGMIRSFLTGKPVPESIGRTRPIAVMFNNIQAALPQSGISNAEVVYEAPVEGGITRLMGILEDYQDIERIGSVRSCRDYYIYLAREFNAYYMHFGQAVYALELLGQAATYNISGLDSEGEIAYYRSDDFEAPHNVFTNYSMIQDALDYLGYPSEYPEDYLEDGHYQFAADGEKVTLDNGQDAGVVSPGYAYNEAYFVYDAETGKYTRYQYGAEQIDYLTGNPLKYDNILFQYCDWQNYDENGYLNIDVISGGQGKYITQGKAIDITWKKDYVDLSNKYENGNFCQTHYYDADGNEITLNQGKTWVCIVLDSYTDDVSICPDMAAYTG